MLRYLLDFEFVLQMQLRLLDVPYQETPQLFLTTMISDIPPPPPSSPEIIVDLKQPPVVISQPKKPHDTFAQRNDVTSKYPSAKTVIAANKTALDEIGDIVTKKIEATPNTFTWWFVFGDHLSYGSISHYFCALHKQDPRWQYTFKLLKHSTGPKRTSDMHFKLQLHAFATDSAYRAHV